MANAAFQVEVDLSGNRVRTRYCGRVTAADMKVEVKRVEALMSQLRPGFSVFADLSGLETMDLDCGLEIARIMDLAKAHGVGLVVRVIPDPRKDIGLNILSLIHYREQVRIVTCTTLAEAEKILGAGASHD